MPSLRTILAEAAPLLLLDATSATVQVGCLEAGKTRWSAIQGEAGQAIFQGINSLQVDLSRIRSFAFADAPGSVLGVRTAAMAIRNWCVIEERPVYAFHALEAIATDAGPGGPTFLADARRDSWHTCSPGEKPKRLTTAQLAGALAMPEGFRHWAPLPPGVVRTPYSIEAILCRNPDADLFRRTDEPDAHRTEEPTYATWTPQIHRAP